MGTEQKIIVLAEQITEQARHLVTNAKDIPEEIKSAYNFMADKCKEYYNGFNIGAYTARVAIYSSSALAIMTSYSKPVAQNIANKFTDTIEELSNFSRETWREAQRVKKSTSEAELTEAQKVFVEQTASLITDGICGIAAVVGIVALATASASVMILGGGIMAAGVIGSSVAAVVTGSLLMASSPFILPLTGLATANIISSIYLVYQDICEIKKQNADKNLTAKELWNIVDKTNHIDQGCRLIGAAIESAIDSVIKSLTLKSEQILESSLKKAIVAKAVTKSVSKDFSHAVRNSKVGRGVRKAKDAAGRSASAVKAKFTEVVNSARTNLSSSHHKR